MRAASGTAFPLQAVRISAAVPILMMEFDRRQIGAESLHALQDSASDRRMLLDQRKFGVAQHAGLLQHVIRHSDLSNVVEQCADANRFLFLDRTTPWPARSSVAI